jgi:tRNA pseudouridine55 synthase
MTGTQTEQLEGVLPVWKPAGWTSHDVVAKVRRLTGVRRIGHAGTLDPAVTGVLPLCVGRATRLVEYLQEMPKSYEAVVTFGVGTDTDDLTGSVIAEADASRLTEEDIRRAIQSFTGELEQIPPMVSAVRVGGKRLYEYARQGRTVERKPRRVMVYDIRILEVRGCGEPRPQARFRVRCSKGTYIRSLCADIGRKLEVPAAMAELVRIESAGLTETDCITLERLASLREAGRLAEALVPGDRLLRHLPAVTANRRAAVDAVHGKAPDLAGLRGVPERAGLVRLYGPDDAFLGIFRFDPVRGAVLPVKVWGGTSGGTS